MSYNSRVYRQRNAHSHDEAPREPFFGKQHDISNSNKRNIFFQAKLSVNQPGDSYEREADAVADAVVNKSSQTPFVQQKKISSIQRLSTSLEDEKLGTNDARMRKDKEIQEKPIQRMEADPEKEKPEGIQKKEEPLKEEDEMKKANAVQAKEDSGASTASPQLSSRIEHSAGKGTRLPKNTLHEMSSSFGIDFNDVRIHKDSEAVNMNKELGAQAFTYGNDIYFNSGKYDPGNSEGKLLLAHELTHVVQQNDAIKRKPAPKPPAKKVVTKAPGFDGTDVGTFIESIDVVINFQGASSVTLNWKNEKATTDKDAGFVLPRSFKTSPGAGQCNRDCGDTAQSNISDSNCTPIGSFTVESFAAHLGDDADAKVVTYYHRQRGIAFHYYRVPDFPQSHGCTRMVESESGADWIQHNSIKGITKVNVSAIGNAKTRKECYYGEKKIKTDDYNKKDEREKILHWYKYAMAHKKGNDGEFYLKEAMRNANGLNDADIERLLKGKNKAQLKEMYDAAVKAAGVGPDSNIAKMILLKLDPPKKIK